ncbi:acyl-CoA carboxylase subunit beta [Candidatus Chlorohelix allophototropha]|uniref:Acyl-CoA carboxylase subunit beta n=1 Tax=Candidatus Chlorohelix allophototropha TaxID=3003348 RepID=A0ABY9B6J5_9CHLR|nr:acyl-CoA carboxylase subunit beta [Chloroflexota bacterium L227-S17]
MSHDTNIPTDNVLEEALRERTARARSGGLKKYREKLPEQKKIFVRERLKLLLDADSFVEDRLLANWDKHDLAADGVIIGFGKIEGRKVALMANDPTVKAGSWGWKTVAKILHIQEKAQEYEIPMLYLVDSAGARITDQVLMFPGERHAGKIFYNEVKMSGVVPQICLLFGPSAAGGAYIPAFCDIVIMVDGNASMYLGSPRMAEMVIGEKVTLEEMGGARMHCTESGCGDMLVKNEEEAIAAARRYLSYFPPNWQQKPPLIEAKEATPGKPISAIVPSNQNKAFNMMDVINRLIDEGSFFEMKRLFARELITGFARIGGRAVGILANQSREKGGVLFVDSADKAARFIWLCNAFNIPLLFLSDVPGFMIGSKVERQGIIRHGAKMIAAVSEATVPKICVVIRKSYGAGLYAMCGPAFEPDCTIALPTAQIAVMGPEAAVNAVYLNQIMELPEEQRDDFVQSKREAYRKDIDIFHLASEMLVDTIISGDDLRAELLRRYDLYADKNVEFTRRRNPVYPV